MKMTVVLQDDKLLLAMPGKLITSNSPNKPSVYHESWDIGLQKAVSYDLSELGFQGETFTLNIPGARRVDVGLHVFPPLTDRLDRNEQCSSVGKTFDITFEEDIVILNGFAWNDLSAGGCFHIALPTSHTTNMLINELLSAIYPNVSLPYYNGYMTLCVVGPSWVRHPQQDQGDLRKATREDYSLFRFGNCDFQGWESNYTTAWTDFALDTMRAVKDNKGDVAQAYRSQGICNIVGRGRSGGDRLTTPSHTSQNDLMIHMKNFE